MSTTAPEATKAAPAEKSSHVAARVAFHVVAIIEAITWAGLLYAMFARYVLDDDGPMAFWGIAHGIAFLVFCAVATIAWIRFRWKPWVWIVAIVMAIPPLMTIPLEIWYSKTGKLKPSGR